MAKGFKTGGREQGTPNREHKKLIEMLAEKYPNYHPVLAMADIANNGTLEINLRFHANKEVAKYICPQLKTVEVKDVATKFKVVVSKMKLPDGTLIEL